MSEPEITVVVPTYRRPDRALRMIDALEQQSLAADRFEVVVVDDGSDDGTVDALTERAGRSPLAVRVLAMGANGGPAVARNAGWRAASAPLIAFIDDDCVADARWLEAGLKALVADEHVGVAQGRTERPDGTTLRDWTLWRQVLEPTPYFEGCNLFFRRAALATTDGFAEDLWMGGEDTDVGWAVLEAGWERAFVDGAVVFHDVEERGLAWRIRYGYRERRNLMTVAARRPAFRAAAFWKPWAYQRDDVVSTLAVAGVVLALRWRVALLLALPYIRYRRPPRGHARPVPFAFERFAVDVAQAAGVTVGAVRNRVFVV